MSAGMRKAAVLLMSLPEDQAADLMGKLDEKQVEQVSIEIAKINNVAGDEQHSTIVEFAEANPVSAGGSGGLDLAKSLVSKALGKNASSTLDTVQQTIEAHSLAFASVQGFGNPSRFAGRTSVGSHPPHREHEPDKPGDHPRSRKGS